MGMSVINFKNITGHKLGLDHGYTVQLFEKADTRSKSTKLTSRGGIISNVVSAKADYELVGFNSIWIELQSANGTVWVNAAPDGLEHFYIDKPTVRIDPQSADKAIEKNKNEAGFFGFISNLETVGKVIIGIAIVGGMLYIYSHNKEAIDGGAKALARRAKKLKGG